MNKQPVIVISRQYGSGGSEIGRRLAEQLGVPYYDKDFVDKAVERRGLSPDFLQEREQKFINSLLFSLATGGYHHTEDGKTMADQVFIAESDAIRQIAQQGTCVIVGRCADYILRDVCPVFSVFVHADLPIRMKRAVACCGVEERRAEKTVREQDRSRARHYQYYTDRSWGDPDNYHLCVNSGRFGIPASVDVIRQAWELVQGRN